MNQSRLRAASGFALAVLAAVVSIGAGMLRRLTPGLFARPAPTLALLFTLPLGLAPAPVGAATLIDDQFADASSTNENLAAHSLRVFQGRVPPNTRTDAAGSVTFGITSSSSEGYWAFFTPSGSPVQLGVGDTLSASVTFSVTNLKTTGGDIRLGLFNSLGSRNTTDLGGGMNHASFAGDFAYGVQFYATGSGSPFAIGERTSTPSSTNNPFNNFADFPALTASASGSTTRTPLASATPYTLTLTVARTEAARVVVTVSVTGGALPVGYGYTAADTSDVITAFDCFAFRIGGVSFADAIQFTRWKIDYTPALPVITTQPTPAALTVAVGANASFSMAATGAGLSYLWHHDATPLDPGAIPSATTDTLTLTGLQESDTGAYRCHVTNTSGTVISEPAQLTVTTGPVDPAPQITQQPAPAAVLLGTPATFTVTATGNNLLYQWFKGAALIPGATSASYTIPAVTVADTASYRVTVSNSGGSLPSDFAALTVLSPMTVRSLAPATGASDLPIDQPLHLTFSQRPALGTAGQIRVRRASDSTLVATLSAAAPIVPRNIAGTTYNTRPVLLADDTATLILGPSTTLAYGTTYFVEIDPGTFVDGDGASFAGLSGASTWTFTTRAAGPAAGTTALTVATDGSGDFATLQGAIDFVPAANATPTTITLRPGSYHEIIRVPSGKNALTIVGQDRHRTIVHYANNNTFNPGGTAQRILMAVEANDVTLRNFTLRNTTPKGGSQAEALRTGNNVLRCLLDRMSLYSYQDTLLASGQTFVTDSYLEGDVDYMWGIGTVFFQRCTIRTLTSGGYLTQIRNDQSRPGNIYVDCDLTASSGVSGVYLARIDPNVGAFPYSQVVFIDCRLGAHIHPAGWLLNNATSAPDVKFWEYNSRDFTGAPLDVSQRLAASRQLTATEAAFWRDPQNVFAWTPDLPPVIDAAPASQTVAVGSPVTLTVAATGYPALSYTWLRNGQPFPAAPFGPSLTRPAAQAADAGTYTVTVSNSAGSVTSAPAVLTVTRPPEPFTTFAATAGLDPYAPATLTSDTDLDGVPALLEFVLGGSNGTPDAGLLPRPTAESTPAGDAFVVEWDQRATLGSVTTLLERTDDLGSWTPVLGLPDGMITIAPSATPGFTTFTAVLPAPAPGTRFARLQVQASLPPLITTQPAALRTVAPGGELTLSVTATGSDAASFVYQWFRDGVALAGQTAPTLQLAGLTLADAGRYTVVVNGTTGSTTSTASVVAVAALPPAEAFAHTGFATMLGAVTGGGPVDLQRPDGRFIVIGPGTPNPAALLKLYLEATDPYVIELQTDIDLGALNNAPHQPLLHPELLASKVGVIRPKSHKTLFSVTGATLRHGTLSLNGVENVILRGLRFRGLWEWDDATAGDYDLQNWDYVALSNGARRIWIDHCDFAKAYDGLLDITTGSDLVTVSWCRFSGDVDGTVATQIAALEAIYTSNPGDSRITTYASRRATQTPAQIIASELGQKKCTLIGSSDTDNAIDQPGGLAKLNVTLHHNHYSQVRDRTPRLRFGNVHVFNLWTDNTGLTGSTTGATAATTGAVFVENSAFREVTHPLRLGTPPYDTGRIVAVGSQRENGGVVSPTFANQTPSDPALFLFNAPHAFTWTDLSAPPYAYVPDGATYTRDHLATVGALAPATASDAALLRTYFTQSATP